jgi:uncharacterized membrane protein
VPNQRNRSDAGDWRTGLVVAVLMLAYAIVAHYASATASVGPWVILLAGAPIAIIGFAVARDSRIGLFFWLLAIGAMGGLAWFWSSLRNPATWLYFLQHFSVNAVLALVFGKSLLSRRRPVCTALASVVHDEMTPLLARYTRQVTLAWTLFFAVSALLSAVLFAFAPIDVWSIYANVLSFPLLALMFVAENEVRKRVLPPRDHVGIRATVRAFRTAFRP